MDSPSEAFSRRWSNWLRNWIKFSFSTIVLCCSPLLLPSVGLTQVNPAITSSGLNTTVVQSENVYTITGGTRAGTNLFHSFGDFNVPTNNIANFLNETPNLSTSNILGRVTGGTPSSIFGTIQTTDFGNANLFLMNPAGIVFGPIATLNVGGSVKFTTANYLHLAEVDGTTGIFHADPASFSVLTSATVASFGFLGSNPAAIAAQGSTLTVQPGQSISLVGGNQGFTYTNPDTGETAAVSGGVTMTSGLLSALGGQINLVSVASPGEVLYPSLSYGPNINGAQFTNLGNVSLTEGALVDVSANSAGTVKIRGGELVIENSTVSADTGGADGAPVAIDISVADAVSISNINLSALTASTSGAGNSGNIMISSGSLNATFGTDSLFVPLIDSHTTDGGHGGNVSITTGPLTVNADPFVEGRMFIISGTGGKGNGGTVTIIADDVQFTLAGINTGGNFFGGVGSSGNLTVKSDSLVLDTVAWDTDSPGAKAGAISLKSSGLMQATNSFITNTSLLGENPVTVKADRFVLDNSSFLSGTVFVDAGDFNVTARVVELSNGGIISTQAFGDGKAGNVQIIASERVSLTDPNGSALSGIFTSSIGDSFLGTHGDAGSITINTPRLELTDGAQINSTTFASGRGGDVTIHANSVSITGERSSGIIDVPFFAFGGTRASGIYTKTLGSDLCSGSCGNAGNINIGAGSLLLQNGGLIDSGTSSNGPGGSITVSATGQVQLSGTMADGTPAGILSRTTGTSPDSGAGGTITLTAGNSVTISNGATISASSTGPADAGNIMIKAGQQLDMRDSSIKTEAAHAGGGNIDIQAVDRVRLVNSTISTSVLGGSGSGGNITIDPNVVVLQNSQVIAQAVHGAGGNITIATSLFLVDQTSLVSASSQFGLNGTVTILSPTSNLSGSVGSLPSSIRQQLALQAQRCAAQSGGASSSFIIAGRDTIPTEPGGWLASPLGLHSLGGGLRAETTIDEQRPTTLAMAQNSDTMSLRRLTPAGFLTQRFAGNGSDGCRS